MKTVTIRDGRAIVLRRLDLSDLSILNHYLESLGDTTRKRFGPHPYTFDSLNDFYRTPRHIGFIGIDAAGMIVSYAVIRIGFLDHDQPRLESYGLKLDHDTDACFAPSVSDLWQGLGIGDMMLSYILDELREMHIKRVILWGGVQANNEKAINYYLKNGFRILGQFEYYGLNLDMMREV
jgi:ribosomal protein S18 acetylase RimI-like enzyme